MLFQDKSREKLNFVLREINTMDQSFLSILFSSFLCSFILKDVWNAFCLTEYKFYIFFFWTINISGHLKIKKIVEENYFEYHIAMLVSSFFEIQFDFICMRIKQTLKQIWLWWSERERKISIWCCFCSFLWINLERCAMKNLEVCLQITLQ